MSLQPEKLLIFAAEPTDEARLQLGKELRIINDRWERSRLRDQWTVAHSPATRVGDLQHQMLNNAPFVVHFSGHGAGSAGLALEDETGSRRLVQTGPLAQLFKLFKDEV